MWYKTIKKYYSMGFYNDEDMKVFVASKDITPEQYKEITGKDYIG
jgi:uncharacterized XkdX family phage protein